MLITVMSERELHVPRLGRVVADPGFRLVAAMNPFDAVGTARISSAVYDRVCRLSVDYQTADEEAAIVARAVAGGRRRRGSSKVVELVRRTRTHPDLRVGSSVRGALDATAVVRVAGDAARAAGRRRRRSASTPCSSPCPAGCGCARAACARPRRSSPSCGSRSSASRRPARRRRRRRREKPRPRRGLPLPEGGPAGGRGASTTPSARRCRGASWPGTPSFDEVSPERRRSSTRRRSTTLMAEDADEALALLADMTRATDAGLRELARRLAGRLVLDVARRGPARPARQRAHRRRAVPARRRRPRHRRQHRGDRRGPGGPGAASTPSGCASGAGCSRAPPCACSSTAAGRWAGGRWRRTPSPRRRWRSGRPTTSASSRSPRTRSSSSRRTRRRRSRRSSTACSPCAATARPTSPAPSRPPASSWPGRPPGARSRCCCRTAGPPSPATWSSPRPRSTSWRSSPPPATTTPPSELADAVGAAITTVAGPTTAADALARVLA